MMTRGASVNAALILRITAKLAKLTAFLSIMAQFIVLSFLQLDGLISNDDARISERGKQEEYE